MTRLDPMVQDWMSAPRTRKLMAVLEGQARFVGGAIRNTLLGKPVGDIDIATPLTPDKVAALLTAGGIKAVPTGIAHGTITAVVDGKPFEITTLRRDIATDGRHAVVAFTEDWAEDAQRRDFTINALYASMDGEVFDFVGGVEDLAKGRVRFVGEASARIAEDYLRILRLFRFHAWYGKGDLDAEALRAAASEKAGLQRLSGERIAKEILKLLEAENPAGVLRAMENTGILECVLPGLPAIARLERLIAIDAAHGFGADALLRLAALSPSDSEAAAQTAERWKLSNVQRERLEKICGADKRIGFYLPKDDAEKMLYRQGAQVFNDLVFISWAEDLNPDNNPSWRALIEIGDNWNRPRFPLSGSDAIKAGVPEGPLVGKVLGEVEAWWIENDFTADTFSLAERLRAAAHAARG